MKKTHLLLLSFLLVLVVCNGVGATPTFEQIIANVEEQVLGIEAISTKAVVDVHQGELVNRLVIRVVSDVSQQLAKIEFLEPMMMAGQLIVTDQAQGIAKIYMPAFNQIIEQPLEDMAAGMGMGLNVTDLSSLLDFNSAEVEGYIEQIIESEAGVNYVLAITDIMDQAQIQQGKQLIWINHEFMPFKLEIRQDDTLTVVLELKDLLINDEVELDVPNWLPDVPVLSY